MKVLFICKGNWFRSQIAAAVYNHLTKTSDANSAGTYVGAFDEPEGLVLSDVYPTPDFFEVMEEHDLHIRNNTTKRLTPEMLGQYDVRVSMAEEPYVPGFLKNDATVIWWDVENPNVVDRKVIEETYTKIYELVEGLIKSSAKASLKTS